LRPAGTEDLGFRRGLYADGRAHELAHLGWTDAQQAVFLAQQFALQQRHIAGHHPQADLLMVDDISAPVRRTIGRIDIDRSGSAWRLIEIALVSGRRSQGIGGRLVRWLQSEARASHATIDLHVVADHEAALRFYRRHGFQEIGSITPSHRRMRWSPCTL
jgi:ribosomal protein S18 acetylase RimI-like enzyme